MGHGFIVYTNQRAWVRKFGSLGETGLIDFENVDFIGLVMEKNGEKDYNTRLLHSMTRAVSYDS